MRSILFAADPRFFRDSVLSAFGRDIPSDVHLCDLRVDRTHLGGFVVRSILQVDPILEIRLIAK